jgi:hypothetical protein
MDGFTESKDLNKEILLKMNDRDFIQTCGLNKYFRDLCKSQDYLIYKRRLQKFYPDTLKDQREKKASDNWKIYYAKVIRVIAKMEEKYDFIYSEGNPFIQERVLRDNYRYGFSAQALLTDSIQFYRGIPLIKYALSKGAKIGKVHLLYSLKDLKTLKSLIDNGGDIELLRGEDFSKFRPSKETQEYLHSLGL